jgi:hypothetical protein
MSNRTELHDKIQQITAKIIDLNTGFATKPALNKLDTDLLQKYTVDLYDVILQLQGASDVAGKTEVPTPVTHTTIPIPPPAPQPEPVKQLFVEPTPPKIEAELPKVVPQPVMPPPVVEAPVAPLPIVEEKPVIVEQPQPVVVAPPQPPVVEEKPVVIAPPPVVVEEKPVTPAPVTPPTPIEKPIAPVAKPVAPAAEKTLGDEKEERSLNDRLHVTSEGNDIASKMQQTPIHDLKKAISINKKFEFINQLFKGDHEAYAKSIHYINGLTNGAEANTFFNNLRKQFNWEEENKLFTELAEMIRRRFM